ncbi:hypothetical protein [Methanogenium cariaci]|uniref:hypothetical protein n=1 Tax=Methanogenium cariaci TaxID=2197 RepID=UPI0012F69B30|nr:hypothetical protein [Methanogenium cariaci]
MTTKQMEESAILSILIIGSTSLILPFTLYALEVGVTVNLAIIAYITGLLVGMAIMLIARWIARRSKRNRMGEMNDGNGAKSPSDKSLNHSKQWIVVITILAIAVAMVYPVHLYAPDAKALFIPLIYWMGVILGTSLMWHVVRISTDSSDH